MGVGDYMNVTLNYHRRHGLHCEGKHTAGTYTSEPEERKKGWARCKCLIYASGSLNRVARRMGTKKADWQAARELMAPYIAANSWEPPPDPTDLPPKHHRNATDLPPADPDDDRVPEMAPGKRCGMEEAIAAYLDEYRAAAWNTQKLCRYATTDLQTRSTGLGLRWVHEWTPLLVRQLRASWQVSPATARKKLGSLKTFFEFCLEAGWVLHNPARIKAQRGVKRFSVSSGKQRLPFTDEELERMYAGCKSYGLAEEKIRPNRYSGLIIPLFKWGGEDLADFISISVYTGMRISDVATFHIERLLESGEVHIRTIKSQGETKVYTWVPEWLAQNIRARARKFGPYIFGSHATDKIDSITDPWRERLDSLWKQTGPWKVKPVHHRFRHTFARVLLQHGTPVATVAELMGNTEAIVRKHYKAWVPELQERTTAILKLAFAGAPRPEVVRKSKVQAIG